MITFKKSFSISLCFLAFVVLSAFTFQSTQNSTNLPFQNTFQASINATPTANALGSDQVVAQVKHQKNSLPTKTPKPTGTPPVIPPPADPGASNMMIGLAILPVIVILFGFWLNRQRVF
jgi:hypothetical protein